METDVATYIVAGVGLFLAGVVPLSRWRVVSTAMAFVAVGVVAGVLPLPLPGLLPADNLSLIERLTEVTVVVALMGAGLAIDRRPGWRAWSSTWRLLALTMPLTIGAVALLGWGLLGLAPAGALLLAAALAPTDPVLASEVRVGGPNSEEDVVRRGLTSEAGLNDGLAFPFVYAAILLAAEDDVSSWIARWVAWDLFGKVLLGVGLGIVVGRVFAWLAFRKWPGLAESNEGILALSATFASYGLVEAAHGWGFVAVFVTGLTIRGHETDARYHADLHEFAHQIERLLTLAALLMFGVACGSGLLAALTWEAVLLAVLLVVVIRPGLGMLSLIGCQGSRPERFAKAFFGVRGIAAFYYLAYGIGHASFDQQELLWATAAAVVLCSILVHGVTAAPALQWLDARRGSSESRPAQSRNV